MTELAELLCRHCERITSLDDVKRAIVLYREVVSCTPATHPNRPSRLCGCGTALLYKLENGVDSPEDLDQSIALIQESVTLTPHDGPGYSSRLGHKVMPSPSAFNAVDQ